MTRVNAIQKWKVNAKYLLYKNGRTIDVNLCGSIEGPVRKATEVKQERAVGVDCDVGGQDADEVHGQTGLHHVTRCHR